MDAIPFKPVITLWIQEEYGYRHWIATLTRQEYRELIRRWETMRGLSCTVPVDLIIPQAEQVESRPTTYDATAHIHECGDSHLDGSTYQIPVSDDGLFWIDGTPHETLSLYAECPDLLISRAVSAAEIEVVLSSLLPGFRVSISSALEGLNTAAEAAALVTATGDETWPRRLTILYLPQDHGLGADPHLSIGPGLAAALGVKVGIEGADQ